MLVISIGRGSQSDRTRPVLAESDPAGIGAVLRALAQLGEWDCGVLGDLAGVPVVMGLPRSWTDVGPRGGRPWSPQLGRVRKLGTR